MSLFYDLRLRPAKILFVCQRDSDLCQIAEALARTHESDVLEPSGALAPQIPSLNLASFDVIVNLSGDSIPNQPGVYLLNMPVDRVKEIVPFLASHFRWAREWTFSEEAGSQTTPVPTPTADPQPRAARAASL